MERFNLETWLKDKNRKVIDDNGFPVEIIHWNAHVKYPVVYLDHNGVAVNVTTDGMYDSDPNHGLFFADEELTEFDYAILSIISDHNSHTDSIEAFAKRSSKKLLDLARKEIEKENSEFKPKFTYNEKDYSKLANKLIEFRNNTPLCSVSYRDGEGRKVILHYEKEILDLVREEFVSKKQYDEDLDKAYKNADKVQFNRGMDEVLTNPQKYFHVGDTIRMKGANEGYTITSIFNGRYYGEGWSLDIIKAADIFELVEDCNEMNMTPQEREVYNAHKKRMKRFTEKIDHEHYQEMQ